MMKKIVVVSDVSLGFGNPQVIKLIDYIQSKVVVGQITVFEPDEVEKPMERNLFSTLPVVEHIRVLTKYHPFTSEGRKRFLLDVAKETNKIKADYVIVVTSSFPLLKMLNYKPEKTIYYCLEMPNYYGDVHMKLHEMLLKNVDLVLVPEENRCKKLIVDFNCANLPYEIIYNCITNPNDSCYKPHDERNGKILYQGTIDYELTFAEWFLNKKTHQFSIDMYGPVVGLKKDELFKSMSSITKGVRFMGYVNAESLARIRMDYSYSIIVWNPISDNFYYAAPNKFFESISAGVPPIAAPHPQCKKIIEKYGCGILMDDWSYKSFIKALKLAKSIENTDRYKELVENCRRAFEEELNWNHQMRQLDKYFE